MIGSPRARPARAQAILWSHSLGLARMFLVQLSIHVRCLSRVSYGLIR